MRNEFGPQKANLLIVEDDKDINALLKYSLESTQAYSVHSCFSGEEALEKIDAIEPNLVLLDVMLPGLFGTEILKKLRSHPRWVKLPVILLTAKSLEEDRVEGFELGADDYITKPFSPKELLLRVQAVLRRTVDYNSSGLAQALPSSEAESSGIYLQHGPITIDGGRLKVTVNGKEIALTATEYNLLVYLALRVGHVQSREKLLQEVWEYDGVVTTRTVDTHIRRLRIKLGIAGELIDTVHGFGYVMRDLDAT